MYWYIKVIKNYFVVKGRAHRTEYWTFILHYIIFGFLVIIIEVLFELITNSQDQTILSTIYELFFFIPSITVGIRRMHDLNRSGLWLAVPVINFIFLVWKGTQGKNRFGLSPRL